MYMKICDCDIYKSLGIYYCDTNRTGVQNGGKTWN